MSKRKLFILTGCLCLFGIAVYAQAPVANFSSNVTAGCGPLTVTFKDLSANTPTSWIWDFGNGQQAYTQNPVISFSGAGTYTVTLIVKNGAGENAIRQTNYITVYPYPTPIFGINLNTACAPANIQMIDYSTPGPGSSLSSWAWTFGDNTPGSNQETPSHTYAQPGYYNIGLTVTNSNGCSNSTTYIRYLRVVDSIQPNFAWNQTSTSCSAPYTLNFINQTAGPGTLTYNWTLGTNATPASSTAANPTGTTYPTADTYNVTLSVQSSLGCSNTITQAVPLSAGSTVINSPDAGCLNTPITFSNGSSPAPLSSAWDFGDGTTSALPAPSKTYTNPGTYIVTLTSTSAACSSTTTKSITIAPHTLPTFTASPTIGCQAPLNVQFTDHTTPTPAQWSWDFGDGSTSTLQSPAHTYTTTGNFDVKLVTSNASGCSDTVTVPQYVKIVPPTLTIPSISGCTNSPILATANVTAIDGVQSYAWTANNATPSTSTAPNPSFTYTGQGYYTLSLTITTTGGCTATATATNIVQVGTPVAPAFTATPNPVCGNNPVIFSAPFPPADGYTYFWNFGDASGIDSGNNIAHIYKNFGNFPATLTLVNFGCPQNTAPLNIKVSPPIPNFGYKINCPANNESVSFIDSSKVDGNPLTYIWDFGDGKDTTINVPAGTIPFNPTHIYTIYDSIPVTLTITDGACTNTVTKKIVVENVIPSFTLSKDTICRNALVNLISTSQSFPTGTPVSSYTWDITGDMGTQVNHAGHIFTTNFPDTGQYTISLVITDINGCSYTSAPGLPASPSLQVIGPTAFFTAPAGACANSTVTFTDLSTPYPGLPPNPIKTWAWRFGGGADTTFTSGPFTHSYSQPGFYPVNLTVIDSLGCGDSYSEPILLQVTSPQAAFSGPDSFYCPNTPLTFIDSSQGIGLTETWNFGDGSDSSTSPTHSFAPNIGPYTVTLSVLDKYNCISTASEPVRIQAPIAAFDIADTTAICTPLQTLFTSKAQFYDSLYWNFGDGSTSTLPVTAHFYNTTDTFYAKLIVQGPGGCLDSATRRILLLNPLTTTKLTYSPLKGCDSVVAQFSVTAPGYTRFTLNFADGHSDSTQDTSLVHTFRNPTSYLPSIILTDSTGCIVTIGGSDGPITVLGAVPFFTVNKQAFCDSATILFTDYTITNDGILSKSYSFGDGSSATQPPPLTTPFDTTHYYNTPGPLLATINVVTNSNCPATYTDTIRDYQTPHPVIADSGLLCTGPIQLLGQLAIPDADTIDWAWNLGNGQTSAVQDPVVNYQPGTYALSLRAFDSFGCSDTVSSNITINTLPVIKGPAEITTPLGIPVTIPFTYGNDIVTWNWTPPVNLDCPTCADPVATLTFNQQYTVTVTDTNSCTSSATILIKTICNSENYFLPNTFSPNGDGVNDYFYPRGTGLYNIQSLTIFNRWGQMVFQRKDFPANSSTMGWDGNFNGHPAPSDAYVYIMEVVCNNAQVVAIHGNVTLVR